MIILDRNNLFKSKIDECFMKSKLIGKVLRAPTIPLSYCLEKLGDYFDERAAMLEACEGHMGRYIHFTKLDEANMVLSEVAGITFGHLAHPLGGGRITKPKMGDQSWFR
jgi:hypothetical protein